MKLKTIATGSKGNCHILTDSNGKSLILDCGVPIKEIKKGLSWNIQGVVGAIVTHHHLDHSKSVKDIERIGVPVLKPYAYMRNDGFRTDCGFHVKSFDLTTIEDRWTHTDADGEPCPCYGFLITHPEMGRMLYITDTGLIKWRFKGINHILLGVNYDKEMIRAESEMKTSHIFSGHLEIRTACDFVKVNHSDCLQNVIMCHLSAENADKDRFIERMQEVCSAAHVDVAEPYKEWRLDNGQRSVSIDVYCGIAPLP